jgi:hypothetical protein
VGPLILSSNPVLPPCPSKGFKGDSRGVWGIARGVGASMVFLALQGRVDCSLSGARWVLGFPVNLIVQAVRWKR